MDLIVSNFYVLITFFAIAALYSSVGHGGATGYLALMALLSFTPEVMRPIALTLNIFVSSIAFYSFYKNGHFRFNLLWPFIAASIPFAFLGGALVVDFKIYKIILGVFLLLAVARMLFVRPSKIKSGRPINILLALIIGAVLGFFSGMIGIGGGIILSPVIILLGWANMKETAAVSAVFILVNSISGLTGFLIGNSYPDVQITYVLIAGIMGAIVGSYMGSFKLKDLFLRYTLASVLLFASVKLFIF